MNWFLDFWLPSKCVVCGEAPRLLCAGCRLGFGYRPRQVSRDGLVDGVATCDYSGHVKKLIQGFKTSGAPALAGFMAEQMAAGLANEGRGLGSVGQAGNTLAFLVPVPSAKAATRVRGFVPAQLLASRLARLTGAKVLNLAELTRRVQDQAGLNRVERSRNLVGAMRAVRAPVEAEKRVPVWLVDDVVTTGASLRELQRCLTDRGWNVQMFVTFAETM